MQTTSGRDYKTITREAALAERYRDELRACGCPIAATEAMMDYAKRLDALEQGRTS